MKRTFLAALIAAAVAAPAFAETSVRLEVLDRQEVVNEAGATEILYTPVEQALPGDIVIYRITLANTDEAPATSVGMTLPVDQNIQINPQSITGVSDLEALFSVDDGVSFASFASLRIETAQGSRDATPDDLTHMRLGVEEIAGNTTVAIEYEARVE